MARGLEFRQATAKVLQVDRGRGVHLRMAREPVSPEVIRVVLDHPLTLVFVEPGVPGAAASTGAATVLLAATVRATAPQLARPRDHPSPPRRPSAGAARRSPFRDTRGRRRCDSRVRCART